MLGGFGFWVFGRFKAYLGGLGFRVFGGFGF